MPRTRDLLVEFAQAILEADTFDMFVMVDTTGRIVVDGDVNMTREQAEALMKYRQAAIDKKEQQDGDPV